MSYPSSAPTRALLAARLDRQNSDTERLLAARDLIDETTPNVRAYVRSRVVPQDAEDVMMMTWERILLAIRLGQFTNQGVDPLNWVMGVARNTVARYEAEQQRQRTRQVALDEQDLVSGDFAGDVATVYDYNQSITALSADDQVVARLIVEGCSISDIALRLGVSYKTAWRRWHRVHTFCMNMLPVAERRW
jgi:RNA polymerase sigma factor (sigma-70 family)